MKLRTLLLLIASHCIAVIIGFAGGIYTLPILIAPPAPDGSEIQAMSSQADYTAQFRRDLKDSDSLHWGEGIVFISSTTITLLGKLAPGPDYQLYLSPEFVETEVDFKHLKSKMVRVGTVNTFDNFVVDVPSTIDPTDFTSVIIWCESFSEFITSAQYQ